jgi:hypothetical protein
VIDHIGALLADQRETGYGYLGAGVIAPECERRDAVVEGRSRDEDYRIDLGPDVVSRR